MSDEELRRLLRTAYPESPPDPGFQARLNAVITESSTSRTTAARRSRRWAPAFGMAATVAAAAVVIGLFTQSGRTQSDTGALTGSADQSGQMGGGSAVSDDPLTRQMNPVTPNPMTSGPATTDSANVDATSAVSPPTGAPATVRYDLELTTPEWMGRPYPTPSNDPDDPWPAVWSIADCVAGPTERIFQRMAADPEITPVIATVSLAAHLTDAPGISGDPASYTEVELTGVQSLVDGTGLPDRTAWIFGGEARGHVPAGGSWALDGRAVVLLEDRGAGLIIANTSPLVGEQVVLDLDCVASDSETLPYTHFVGEVMLAFDGRPRLTAVDVGAMSLGDLREIFRDAED